MSRIIWMAPNWTGGQKGKCTKHDFVSQQLKSDKAWKVKKLKKNLFFCVKDDCLIYYHTFSTILFYLCNQLVKYWANLSISNQKQFWSACCCNATGPILVLFDFIFTFKRSVTIAILPAFNSNKSRLLDIDAFFRTHLRKQPWFIVYVFMYRFLLFIILSKLCIK